MNAKQVFLNSILKNGERYAGILLGENDEIDFHIILLPLQISRVSWQEATDFALNAGGSLPTKRELSLIIANLKDALPSIEDWSCEKHIYHNDFAWCQCAETGSQFYEHQKLRKRARVIRRLPV